MCLLPESFYVKEWLFWLTPVTKIYGNFYSLFPTLCPQKQRAKERSAFCNKFSFIEVTPLLFQMSLDYLSNSIIIKEKWQYAQRQLSFWRIVMLSFIQTGRIPLISLLASIPPRGYVPPWISLSHQICSKNWWRFDETCINILNSAATNFGQQIPSYNSWNMPDSLISRVWPIQGW